MLFYVISTSVLFLFFIIYIILIWDSIFTNLNITYIDVSSSKRAIEVVKKIIKELGIERGILYDLGSGRGSVAIGVKKAFPEMQVFGFDRSLVKIVLSRVRSFLSRAKVKFTRKNFFKVNLGEADIIYNYTWHSTIRELRDKIEKEAKSGAFIISNTFPLPDLSPAFTREVLTRKNKPSFEKIYIYRKQ